MGGRIRPTIVVFLLLALTPIALFGWDGPWFGGGDRPNVRRLAPFPRNLTASTFRRVSLWLNEHVGLRYPLILIGSRWQMALWGNRIHNNVLIGDDAWLFYKDDEAHPAAMMVDLRGRLRLSARDAAAIEANFTAIRAALARCGRTVFVLFAPNKQSIYPEHLPTRIAPAPSRLDDFLARLRPELRAIFIDPRPELRAAKASESYPLFHKTDTHWNALGALVAYQKAVAVMARANALPAPELAARERFTVSAEPYAGGDLGVTMLYAPWVFPDQKLRLRGTRDAPLIRVDPAAGYKVYVSSVGSSRLLVQGDSYFEWLEPLLAQHFAETHVFTRPASMAVFDGDLIARLKPDVVLLQLAERHVAMLAEPPRNLARMCD